METHFGSVLRQARERRQISLADVAERTKVPRCSLELLESGNIDDLPADVFVRGFIRSYARSVGIADSEPLGMFEEALATRRRLAEAQAAIPSAQPADGPADEDVHGPRRGIGIAVFVIIVLLIATITLSLFLRQPPRSGEGLSLRSAPAGPCANLGAWRSPSPPRRSSFAPSPTARRIAS
jgi:cytoskeletal protein RodZ